MVWWIVCTRVYVCVRVCMIVTAVTAGRWPKSKRNTAKLLRSGVTEKNHFYPPSLWLSLEGDETTLTLAHTRECNV